MTVETRYSARPKPQLLAYGQARIEVARIPTTARRAHTPKLGVRHRNRCRVCGRPRGYYRKLRMSRIALRDLGSQGLIPGMIKSSW